MVIGALLLAAALLPAQEIFRCVGDDGTLQFRDRPCAEGTTLGEPSEGAAATPPAPTATALPPGSTSQPSMPAPRPPPDGDRRAGGQAGRDAEERAGGPRPVLSDLAGTLPVRPTDERLLAACSIAFYECSGEGSAMDGCVAAIPACQGASVGAPCCAPAFVTRYRMLRSAALAPPSALRFALLGGEH